MNSFREVETLFLYFGVLKTKTQKNNSGVVRGSEPTSLLEGLCMEEIFYFSRVSLEDTEQATCLLPISDWNQQSQSLNVESLSLFLYLLSRQNGR